MYLCLFPSVRKMDIHEDTRQMVTITFSDRGGIITEILSNVLRLRLF